MFSLVFEAIGTRWQIDVTTSLHAEKKDLLDKQIRERIEKFDKTYSRFIGDSVLRKMAAKTGEYKLPDDAGPLFSLYDELYQLSGGYFTPFIGQVLADAGYDETYSLKAKQLRRPPSWYEVVSYDSQNLIIKQPTIFDFGACGKGYLVDIVGDILEMNGVTSYCIDAGGDIRYRSDEDKIFRIGLENPYDSQQVIGVVNLENQSICGSAGNRRRWGDYHHIIDPFSLTSVEDVSTVWVVAGTTMLADALSTCLFFVAPEKLLNRYCFEYIIMYSDYSIRKSEGFSGELFLRK